MYKLTAFLCGHFHRDQELIPQQLAPAQWEPLPFDPSELTALKRTFYAEFIDLFAERCTLMRRHVERELELSFRGQTYRYRVNELMLYQMPMGMTLFSIRLRMAVTDLNEVTALLSSLRQIDHYHSEPQDPFVEAALAPIKWVYDHCVSAPSPDISALVENGNKLKIFQVVNAKASDAEMPLTAYANSELLLYQLGSVARVTSDIDDYSPSDAYLEKVMSESRLSIFRNWQALSLMDTFTILSTEAPAWLVDNWTNCYFRFIYIHSLFVKCFLFRLNKHLRAVMTDHPSALRRLLAAIGSEESEIYGLIRTFKQFDRQCRFHKISYNFLPLEVASAIDRGLCISEELDQLDQVLEREKQRRDEANDKMVNALLFILSTLTLGSAIWDFSCLLDQMFPYSDYLGSSIIGYRTVALLVLLGLAFVVTRLFQRGEK